MTPQDYAREYLPRWQAALRLADWRIAIIDAEPDDREERSSVHMDVIVRSAVIRFRSDTPESQVVRQLIHELLHIRLADVEDVYRLSLEHTPPAFDKVANRTWHRGLESAIEALTDAIHGSQRADWCSGPPWDSAFPAPENL